MKTNTVQYYKPLPDKVMVKNRVGGTLITPPPQPTSWIECINLSKTFVLITYYKYGVHLLHSGQTIITITLKMTYYFISCRRSTDYLGRTQIASAR